MLSHYLRHAARLLAKQRLHAGINVLGLAAALGLCALIAVFIKYEHTYDAWHDRLERIYRVDRVDFNPDGSVDDHSASHPFRLAGALKRDHPDIEESVRFNEADVVFRIDGVLHQEDVIFADASFFDVFSYQPIHGDLRTALQDPAAMVLTESAAARLLGTGNPLGQSLSVRFDDSFHTVVVAAVIADPPANTNIPFEVMMSFERLPTVYPWVANRVDSWRHSSFPTYVLLREGVDLSAATETIESLRLQYYPGEGARGRDLGWWAGEGEPNTYALIPLSDLHLRSDVPGGFVATSDPSYSWILFGIGLLILVLACINFTLLTMGKSSVRAEEIGVRKALGAGRWEIMSQFGGESLLMALLGLLGGFLFASFFQPVARAITGRQLDLLGEPGVLMAIAAIALVSGLVAGSYPALMISRGRPSEALSGRFSLGGSSAISRGLLITQFAASVALIAGALVMQAQIRFLQEQDRGYDPSNIIVVSTNGTDGFRLVRHLRDGIGHQAGVLGVSGMSLSLNRGYSASAWGVDGVEKRAYVYNVAPDLTEFLGMDMLAGRAFDAARATDSTDAVIVNEAFARDWGWTPEEAVGQAVTEYNNEPEIIGVVRDMNFRSLHEEVQPMMLMQSEGWLNYALVRASSAATPQVLSSLEDAWSEFTADAPLQYTFLDDDVALAYEEDRRWARIIGISASLAILVACMGLFGLAALTVSQRTKEIGIRKVLGASVQSVTLLVSREFAILVGVAALIGGPLAYLGLSRWLDGFAFRMELAPWWFLAAGILVLLVAMSTVAFHSVRAAVSDPVKSLRYE
jgi:putative ABC transport system permease protein